jgi:hypothetical protein
MLNNKIYRVKITSEFEIEAPSDEQAITHLIENLDEAVMFDSVRELLTFKAVKSRLRSKKLIKIK